ncbi:acetyltransferase [Phenylobacterium sp.]|uniref:acetyltransferase n=1 Tax=Phenylobacterium sp. TaxID=1871053 RepID=UPI002C7FC572|nr:acetyltransferase [Phenylobacterium sp.]HVI33660.1 acetyltransferase [Phenylobacterium sp.]
MTRKLVMFGTRQIAEVLAWYIERESDYRIEAFTVDGEYLTETSFQGRPVVAFEEVARRFGPDEHEMFVALSYAKMNRIRAEKFAAAKAAGYRLASHVSPKAQVWDGLQVGENSFVMEHNVVQPFARIGADTTLWAGNHIGHHSIIGDHCFLASHIVVSGRVTIGDHCFIGVNATLRDGITVAPRCLVGAGALLLADTEEEQVFMAEPTPASRVPSSRVRI